VAAAVKLLTDNGPGKAAFRVPVTERHTAPCALSNVASSVEHYSIRTGAGDHAQLDRGSTVSTALRLSGIVPVPAGSRHRLRGLTPSWRQGW